MLITYKTIVMNQYFLVKIRIEFKSDNPILGAFDLPVLVVFICSPLFGIILSIYNQQIHWNEMLHLILFEAL